MSFLFVGNKDIRNWTTVKCHLFQIVRVVRNSWDKQSRTLICNVQGMFYLWFNMWWIKVDSMWGGFLSDCGDIVQYHTCHNNALCGVTFSPYNHYSRALSIPTVTSTLALILLWIRLKHDCSQCDGFPLSPRKSPSNCPANTSYIPCANLLHSAHTL